MEESIIDSGSNTVTEYGDKLTYKNEARKESEVDLEYRKIIDAEFAENGTSVSAELEKQIVQYQELLASETNASNRTKIQKLIATTLMLKNQSSEYSYDGLETITDGKGNNEQAEMTSGPDWASIVITYFNLKGYKLSAELMTHAVANQVVGSTYEPIFGSRVLSSQLTYDIAGGSETSGASIYESKETVYDSDLYYSIHEFKFATPGNNGAVVITDTYDFKSDPDAPYSEIERYAIHKVYELMELEIIKKYEVYIAVDISEYPRLSIEGKEGDIWRVRIANYKNKEADIVFNKKMCFEYDAKNWYDLRDLEMVTIAANSSVIVSIQENYLATHIVAGYNYAGYRKITLADNLKVNSLGMSTADSNYTYYDNIGIIGKNGTTWIVNITNNYSYDQMVKYNSKMCFEYSANSWTGLRDEKSFYLESGASKTVKISENLLADYIAICFSYTVHNVRYAKDLNIDGSMTVKNARLYNYLGLSISGKTGSTWKINIYNPLNIGITVRYNSKMCNFVDAANWSNLADPKSVYVNAGGTKTVDISENFWATSIAVSYIYNSVRVVSYANGLNTNGSINVMHNVLQ